MDLRPPPLKRHCHFGLDRRHDEHRGNADNPHEQTVLDQILSLVLKDKSNEQISPQNDTSLNGRAVVSCLGSAHSIGTRNARTTVPAFPATYGRLLFSSEKYVATLGPIA
jgi:hypothetical protein